MHNVANLLFAAIFIIVVNNSQASGISEGRFRAVYNTDGAAMCALQQPTETSSVRSQLECSSHCRKNDKCTGFNYKNNYTQQQQQQQQQQRTSMCQVFTNSSTAASEVENCVYYQIQCDPKEQASNNPLLIQQNIDGSRFFNRTWSEFKAGFGNSSGGNYWIGNELLHQLTKDNAYKLRFELQSLDNNSLWFWAEYSTFTVDTEATGYRLQVAGLTGNVIYDAFNYQNGMKFSTWDRDNDMFIGVNCALRNAGGFWYNDCSLTSVNALLTGGDSFRWYRLTADYVDLKTSRLWLVCR